MFLLNRCLISVLLLAYLLHSCDGFALTFQADVKIINDFNDGTILNLHCKSKDDDLGQHALTVGQFFEFKFHPMFLGSTLFFCRFWWGRESHYFDIYVEKRDYNTCDECTWKIHPTGPCRYHEKTKAFDDCYPWNKPGMYSQYSNSLEK